MKSEKFEGTVSQMKKSPWLASEDLEGLNEVEVTIEDVFKHDGVKFEEGRVEDGVFALKFKGHDKQMVLNNTNRKTLSRAFGANTKDWRSKKVKLFVLSGIKAFGKTTTGLRLKVADDRGKKAVENIQ